MNAAQTRLYFFEWGRARAWSETHGVTTAAQLDARRHALHVKALGRDKSSKAFTTDDLDRVIAAFRAVWDGGNLDAQLDAQEAPEERLAAVLDKCQAATWEMYELGDLRLGNRERAMRYVAGTAKNVIGKELSDCTEADLGKVLGCLLRRVRVLRAQNPAAAASLDAVRTQRRQEEPF